jgi:hypothetical protein
MDPSAITPTRLATAFQQMKTGQMPDKLLARADVVINALMSEECRRDDVILQASLFVVPQPWYFYLAISIGILVGMEMAAADREVKELEEMVQV